MNENIAYLSREMETTKKDQVEVLELKNAVSKWNIKILLNELNNLRWQRVSVLGDRSIETIQSKEQKKSSSLKNRGEKRLKMEWSS